MSIHGRLHADGSLTDISYRPADDPSDVPLDEMPTERGAFKYDRAKRSAVRDTARERAEQRRELAAQLRDARRDLAETQRQVATEKVAGVKSALGEVEAALTGLVADLTAKLARQ